MLKYLNLIGSYRLESLPRDTLVKAFIDNKSSVVNIDIYDLLSEGGRKPSYIQCPENGEGGGLGISIRSDNREAAAEIANKCVGVLEKNKAQIELAWTLLEEYRNKNSSLTRAFKNEHTHIPEIYLQRISLENECDGEAGVRNERISI